MCSRNESRFCYLFQTCDSYLLDNVNCFWCHVQVPEGKIEERDRDFSEVAKKTRAKARLIKIGSIPLSDLGKLKAYLLNTKSDGQFSQNGNIVEIGKLCTKVFVNSYINIL